jgi:hypothetical protein
METTLPSKISSSTMAKIDAPGGKGSFAGVLPETTDGLIPLSYNECLEKDSCSLIIIFDIHFSLVESVVC